jgi:hypothetical protein
MDTLSLAHLFISTHRPLPKSQTEMTVMGVDVQSFSAIATGWIEVVAATANVPVSWVSINSGETRAKQASDERPKEIWDKMLFGLFDTTYSPLSPVLKLRNAPVLHCSCPWHHASPSDGHERRRHCADKRGHHHPVGHKIFAGIIHCGWLI